MKRFFLFLSGIFWIAAVAAQTNGSGYRLIGNGSVQAKNFYLLILLQQNDKVRHQLENDPVLARMAIAQNAAISKCLENCTAFRCITDTLQLNSKQIRLVSARLVEIYYRSTDLQNLVKNDLVPSNAYSHYTLLQPVDQLVKAWEQDALDIDSTLAVYADGKAPNYPEIDSISFNVQDTSYIRVVQQVTQQIIAKTDHSHLFFVPSMTAALCFLNVNGRNNAGDYEPMDSTVNKAALQRAKTVNWANYKYTALMVPGMGPDSINQPISAGSIARCKLVAAAYQQGMAPFIITSGGKVHPYKTQYCEALEMKKYLMQNFNIPDSAIIMEPHSRHTTTNMRNSVRLLMQYQFPLKQAALVVSDVSQINSILGMGPRCMQELGDVPYLLGNQISATELEFYGVPVASQINPTEPLDP